MATERHEFRQGRGQPIGKDQVRRRLRTSSRRRRLLGTTLVSALLVGSLPFLPPVQAAIGPGDPPGTVSYLRSANGGDTFRPMQLNDRPPADDVGITHVEASNGTVHALFDNNIEVNNVNARNVLYRRSADGGASFRPSEELDDNNGDSGESDLDTVGTTVHVVWEDDKLLPDGNPDPCCNRPPQARNRDDVFYTRSIDDGRNFGTPVNLTNSDDVHNRDPDVAADGSLVGITYEARDEITGPPDLTNGDDVFFLRSADGGDTWGGEVSLTPNMAGNQDEPAIDIDETTDGQTVHVAFRNRSGPTIAYVRSTDGGASGSFSAPENLPNPTGAAIDTTPGILVQGDLVHVLACSENDAVNNLLYWRSEDGGDTFADPVVVSGGDEQCNKPVLDGVGNKLHIVYERDVFGESEIHYVQSNDGGMTFESPRNLSSDHESSADPSVSVDPGNNDVHISWNDKTDILMAMEPQRLPLEEGGTRMFENEDIVRFSGAAYEPVLDGSDVGLSSFTIDALAIIAPVPPATMPSFVLSFKGAGRVGGLNGVDDSDAVLFTPTRLGTTTAGTFSRYLDGSDIGLTRDEEDVSNVEVEGDTLYLSTQGNFSLSDGLNGADEDVFSCDGFTPGENSTCTSTTLRFDGSAVGLNQSGEQVDAFSFNATGNVPEGAAFFSFTGRYSVPTASGNEADIASCAFPETPPATLADCGTTVPLLRVFRGSSHALKENLTALELEY